MHVILPRQQAGHEGSFHQTKPRSRLPTKHRVALTEPEVPFAASDLLSCTCRLPLSIFLGTTSSQTVVRVQVKDGPARITSAQRSSATTFTTPLILDPSISLRAHSTSSSGPVCLSEGCLKLRASLRQLSRYCCPFQSPASGATVPHERAAFTLHSVRFVHVHRQLQHPLESVPNLDPSINATTAHCNHVVPHGCHRPGDERAPRCEEERWRSPC